MSGSGKSGSSSSSKSSASNLDAMKEKFLREKILVEDMQAVKQHWERKKQLQAEDEKNSYEMEIVHLKARQRAFDMVMMQQQMTSEGEDDVFESLPENANQQINMVLYVPLPEASGNQGAVVGLDKQPTPNICTPVLLLARNSGNESTPMHDTKPEIPHVKRMEISPCHCSLEHQKGSEPMVQPCTTSNRCSDPGPDCYTRCIEFITDQLQKLQMELSTQTSASVEHSGVGDTEAEAGVKSSLNPGAPEWQPQPVIDIDRGPEDTESGEQVAEALKLMHSQIVTSNRELASAILFPLHSIQAFDGNPMEYKRFKTQFQARVGDRVTRVADKLKLLTDSLMGNARDTADLVNHPDPERAYERKWQALEKKYGNIQLVSQAYVNELAAWSVIAYDDDDGLKRLAVFMNDVVNAMPDFPDLCMLNYSTHIADLMKNISIPSTR